MPLESFELTGAPALVAIILCFLLPAAYCGWLSWETGRPDPVQPRSRRRRKLQVRSF